MKEIKLILIGAMAGFLLCGCASIEYGDFKYNRIGDQHIEGSLELPDGTKISLNQGAEATALTEAIRVIGILSTQTP